MTRKARGRSFLSVSLALALGFGQVVAPPPVAFADEVTTQTTTSETPSLVAQAEEFRIGNKDVPRVDVTAALPILKGAGFDFVEQAFGIDKGTLPDGTQYVSIGLDQNNTALMKDLLGGKKTLWENAQMKFINTGTRDNKFGFKPAFKVSALCRINDRENRRDGELVLLAGVAGKKEGQYLIFTGEVSLSGLIGAKVPWVYSPSFPQVSPIKDGLAITGTVGLKLAGGVGVAYIGRVGVYGSATGTLEIQALPRNVAGWNKAQATADLGVEVVALGFRVWHHDFWKGGPWDLFTPRKAVVAQSEPDLIGPVLTASATDDVIVPIDYTSQAGAWLGSTDELAKVVALTDVPDRDPSPDGFDPDIMTCEYSVPQEGMRKLQTDVYPDASVEVVDTPAGAVMCWVAGAQDEAGGKTRLMWSRNDPATDTWSTPKGVRPEGSVGIDFEPCLFSDERGTVHVVWLGSEGAVADDASFADVASRMDVRYATLPAGASDFGAPEVIHKADNRVTTAPQVAAAGTEVVCGWTEIDPAHLTDYAGAQHVVSARRDAGGTWATSERQTHEVTSLDAGLVGSVPCVAWCEADLSMAADGSVTSAPPVLMYVTADGATHTVGTNARNADFADERGHGVLTWSALGQDLSSDLMALDGVGGTPHRVFEASDLPPTYQVDGDLATDALITYPVWEGDASGSRESSSVDIYGKTVVNSRLTDEGTLVTHEDDLTSYDIAYVNGAPVVVALAERGVGAGSGLVAMGGQPGGRSGDLLVASGDALDRIAIDSVGYDGSKVLPGSTVPVTVRVYNAGLSTIEDGVRATVTDDASGQVLGEGTLTGAIRPSEYGEIQVMVRIPADARPGWESQTTVKVNFLGDTPQAVDSFALRLGMSLAYDPSITPHAPVPGWQQTPSDASASYGWPDAAGYSSTDGGSRSVATGSVTTDPVRRLQGSDRYATMETVVSSAFDHSEWAVLASGADYPDALSALALAGAHHAPVVLTAPDALSPQAASALRRLGCTDLICVGGPAAVSDAALDEARAITGSARRVFGGDRILTATELLKETRSTSRSSDTVIVATGTTFADALSAGPWSWHTASPVVLVGPDGTLTDETVEAIRADAGLRRVVIMGGEAAVSESVRTQLGDGYAYVRLAGADRYQTSGAAATWFTQHGLGWSGPFVATGTGFADALSAASVAGAQSSPLLLVNPASSAAASEIAANRQDIRSITIVGGTSAVHGSVEDALRAALG